MRRRGALEIVIALAIAFACAFSSVPAVVAQTPSPQQTSADKATSDTYGEYFMSEEHRRKIYQENRKKPSKAVLYTLLFPGIGNIYAEQYMLAGVAFVFMAFAATFIGYGIANDQSDVIAIGAVTAGIAYGGGITTSVLGVSGHNRKLRQGLKIEQTDVRELWIPALVMRF